MLIRSAIIMDMFVYSLPSENIIKAYQMELKTTQKLADSLSYNYQLHKCRFTVRWNEETQFKTYFWVLPQWHIGG